MSVDQFWPWHWGGWRNESSVVVDAARLAAGNIELAPLLQSFTATTIRSMQDTILVNVHRMLYFTNGSSGDPA